MKTTEPANDEGWSDERLLVKRIWSRAYLDTEEKHIGLLKAYADQQVNKVLDEAIEDVKDKIDIINKCPAEILIETILILESHKIKQP